MTNSEMKDWLELAVAVGELKERVNQIKEQLSEARAVIRRAEGMVNGHADNDHRIAVEVLRPYIARYPEAA